MSVEHRTMIRGYVAIVTSGLPISRVPAVTPHLCRKATVRLVNDEYRQFSINIEGTSYSFKVVGNIRAVDKCNIACGLVRISFVVPKLDMLISCNHSTDVIKFVHTVEVINDVKTLPPRCSDKTHWEHLYCVCKVPGLLFTKHYHITTCDCPLLDTQENLCPVCCRRILACYNDDDKRKIYNSWKLSVELDELPLEIHNITATSFPYLKRLAACRLSLEEIPESLGSLPCLTEVYLSDNRLGKAKNWNWLTSPFVRENLHSLWLDYNDLHIIPEPILGLKNLECLSMFYNSVTEIPVAFGNLSSLLIQYNLLQTAPAWLYHKAHLPRLFMRGNKFLVSAEYHRRPQLNSNDFAVVTVSSLLEIAIKYIITERLAFWEYSLPEKLSDLLEKVYCCRCGSVVFPYRTGRVVQCYIKTEALAYWCDMDEVPMDVHCCSYKCYKLIEPYIL